MPGILLAPPIPGVCLSVEAAEDIERLLRARYSELLSPNTLLEFAEGWTWLVASLLEELEAARSECFSIVAIRGEYAELQVYLAHEPSATASMIIERYRAHAARTCRHCGAAGRLCREKNWFARYCVICRTLFDARPEEERRA
jgi:hypothetical protein